MVSSFDEARIMRALSTFPQVYVYRGLVDFRKSIDGLSAIVESDLKLKPFSGGNPSTYPVGFVLDSFNFLYSFGVMTSLL